MSYSIPGTDDESERQQQHHGSASLVVATRIHLGNQSTPPPQSKLSSMVSSFLAFSSSSPAIIRTAIAVDPAPKIPGYDLVQAVREAIDQHSRTMITDKRTEQNEDENDGPGHVDGTDDTDPTTAVVPCDLLPVTPWGNFVPALNALTSWACTIPNGAAERILFVSAETTLAPRSVEELCRHVGLDDTLVAGAVLPGHDYRGGGNGDGNGGDAGFTSVELDGRTCPWNTCAIWNLRKLALTGFPLVADGLHRHDDGRYVFGHSFWFST